MWKLTKKVGGVIYTHHVPTYLPCMHAYLHTGIHTYTHRELSPPSKHGTHLKQVRQVRVPWWAPLARIVGRKQLYDAFIEEVEVVLASAALRFRA